MARSPLADIVAQAETEDFSTPTPIPAGMTPRAPAASEGPYRSLDVAPRRAALMDIDTFGGPAVSRQTQPLVQQTPDEVNPNYAAARKVKTGYYEVKLPDGGVDYIPDNLTPEEAAIEIRRRHSGLQQGMLRALGSSAAQGALVDAPKGVLTAVSLLQATPYATDPDMQRVEERFQQLKEAGRADLIEAERARLRTIWDAEPGRVRVVDELATRAAEGLGPRPVTRIQDTSGFRAGQRLDEWGRRTFPVLPENEGIATGIARGVGQIAPTIAAGIATGGASVAPNVALRAIGTVGNLGIAGTFAGMNIGESIEAAVKAGATDEQIRQVAVQGGVPAALFDYLSFNRFIRPITRTPGGWGMVQAAAKRAAENGLTEGTAEFTQTVLQNLAAAGIYDPTRAPAEGGGEAFAVGAGVGAIAGAGSAPFVPQRDPNAAPTLRDIQPPGAPRVEPTLGTPPGGPAPVDPTGRVEPTLGLPPSPAPGPGPTMTPGGVPPTIVPTVPAPPAEPPGMGVGGPVAPTPATPTPDTVAPPQAAPPPVPGGLPPAAPAPVGPDGVDIPDELSPDDIGRLTGDTPQPPPVAAPPVAPPAPPPPPPPPTKNDLIGQGKGELGGFLDGNGPPPVPGTPEAPVDAGTPGAIDKAAASQPEPTPGQAEAGNYKKTHVDWNGIKIAVETPKGQMRRGVGKDGAPWEVAMPVHYGYAKRTEGNDGDELDFFIGDDPASRQVFVVDQIDAETGLFDEHKVMVGFPNQEAAQAAYEASFSDGRGYERSGAVVGMSVEQLKTWMRGDLSKPLGYQALTPADIHRFADEAGVSWSTPAFMGASERLTGERHLDKMTPRQLRGIAEALAVDPSQFQAPAEAPAGPRVAPASEMDAEIDSIFGNPEKDREGWQYTRDEVRRLGPEAMERLFWKPAAERIYRQAGTTDLQGISDYYAERYGIKPLKIKRLKKAFESGNGGVRITHGMVTGRRRADGTIEPEELYLADTETEFEKVMTLRHELEHLIDWKNGFKAKVEAGVDRGPDGKLRVVPGHHRYYDIFNYDYPHRIVVRDALGAGLPVPENVLKDYPDLVADYKSGAGNAQGKFGSPASPDVAAVAQHIARQLVSGADLSDIRKARKMVNDLVGGGIAEKRAEEMIELGVVMAAREYANAPGQSPQVQFDQMVDLYERQPRLITRTVGSVENQAYSTPAPLAFVASHLADITPDVTVLEPTAGNGMLLMQADPSHTFANEIDTRRQLALSTLGFTPMSDDATVLSLGGRVDRVIANPPFGKRLRDGRPEIFTSGLTTTQEIDHHIVGQSLAHLKDDGRAVLIIGSKRGRDAEGNAYGGKHAEFYKNLYDAWNVVDHFTVGGDLYARQGTTWPVDVIVIEGRNPTGRPPRLLYPAGSPPPVVTSWADLKGVLNDGVRINNRVRGPEPGQVDAGGGQQRPPGGGVRVEQPPEPERVPPRAEGPVAGVPAGRSGDTGGGGGQGPTAPVPQPEPGGRGGGAGSVERRPEPVPRAGGEQQPVDVGRGDAPEGPAGAAGTGGDIGNRGNDAGGTAGSGVPESPRGVEQPPTAKPDRDAAARALAERLKKLRSSEVATGGASDRDRLITAMYDELKPVFTEWATEDAAAGEQIDVSWVRKTAEKLRPLFEDAMDRWPLVGAAMKRWLDDVREGRIDLTAQEDVEVERKKVERDESQATDLQVQYVPRADFGAVGTLVPKAMMTAVDRSLDALTDRLRAQNAAWAKIENDAVVIERFLENRLGYKEGEIRENGYFSAEQADALAMAIDSHERGGSFIIGDQTGVGKGRIVAGLLRYASQQKMIPIFVTAKSGLYEDMYRDINDIGWKDFKALPTNRDLRGPDAIPLPPGKDGEERVLTSPKPADQDLYYNHMQTRGTLPAGYDALFTTYTQLSPNGGNPTIRQLMIKSMAGKAMMVLDESHEAGGVEEDPRNPTPNSVANYMRSVLPKARGAIYSSATFAKRPQTMSLYSRTTMTTAVGGKMDLLEAVLTRGGVPLQQVMSQMLVEDGQYIRREKSFEGIELKNQTVEIDEKLADQTADLTRSIFLFDQLIEGVREEFQNEVAGRFGSGGKKKDEVSNASTTGFASIMHNIVSQSLLALKADQAAAEAIAAHKDGKKPILTVSNTMGAILEKLQEDGIAKPGEVLTFKDVYRRYLKKVMTVTVFEPKGPGSSKKARKVMKLPDGRPAIFTMTEADILRLGKGRGEALVSELRATNSRIDKAAIDALPLSPIDRMLEIMRREGMKVGEITGRKVTYDQATGKVEGREDSQALKKRAMNDFNNNRLDALIINRSGSTGFSLHASKAFPEPRKPRKMFIVQGEANITDYIQMLGRINRTGQVVLPEYAMLVGNLPAEKRPAAVVAKKYASLSASTTAGRKGAYSNKETVDFFNEVGAEAALEYLRENHQLASLLNINLNDAAKDKEGFLSKLTGRAALLPVRKRIEGIEWMPSQEELFSRIEALFLERLKFLDSIGENPLEAKTVDLKAKVITETVLEPPKSEPTVFANAGLLQQLDVERLIKPMNREEVADWVFAGIPTDERPETRPKDWEGRMQAGAAYMSEMAPKIGGLVNNAVAERMKQLEADLEDARMAARGATGGTEAASRANDKFARVQSEIKAIEVSRDAALEAISNFARVRGVKIIDNTLPENEREKKAVLGIIGRFEFEPTKLNPAALSNFRISIAVESGDSRTMDLKLSQAIKIDTDPKDYEPPISLSNSGFPARDIISRMERQSTSTREIRYMLTGNLISAFAKVNDGRTQRGQFVMYTTEEGDVRPGVLLPRSFTPTDLDTLPANFTTPDQIIQYLNRSSARDNAHSSDRSVRLARDDRGAYTVVINSKGNKAVYTNEALISALGVNGVAKDEKVGKTVMYRTTDAAKMEAGIGVLIDTFKMRFQTSSDKKLARSITGEADPSATTNVKETLGGSQSLRNSITLESEKADDGMVPEKILSAEDKAELKKWLKDELRALGIPDVMLSVVDQIKSPRGSAGRIRGQFTSLAKNPLIKIAAWTVEDGGADPMQILRHEAVHAMRELGLFTKQEWKLLSADAKADWMTRYDIGRRYAGLPDEIQTEEAIAEGLSHGVERMMAGDPPKPWLRRVILRVAKFLRRVWNFMRGMGFQVTDDVILKFMYGDIGDRPRTPPQQRRGPTRRNSVDPRVQSVVDKIGWKGGKTWKNTARDIAGSIVRMGSAAQRAYMLDHLKFGLFDAFDPLRMLEKRHHGHVLDASESAWKMAQMSQNLPQVMDILFNRGTVNYDRAEGMVTVRPGTKGLTEIFERLNTPELQKMWGAWAVAVRADRLEKEGRENLLSRGEIDDALKIEADFPWFRTIFNEWNAFNQQILDFAEQAELINAQQRSLWEKSDYIPFYRMIEDANVAGPSSKGSIEGQRSGIRTLFGGEEMVADVYENIIRNVAHLVDASYKNLAMLRATEIGQAAGVMAPMAMSAELVNVPLREAKKKMTAAGLPTRNLKPGERDALLQMFAIKPPKDADAVSVMINGKPKWFKVSDPLVLGALQSFTFEQQGVLLQIAGAFKRALTRGVTMTPDFLIANFARDSISSWAVSGEKVIPIASGVKWAVKEITGRAKAETDEVAAAGAGGAGYFGSGAENLRKNLESHLLRTKFKISDPKTYWASVVSKPRQLWELWDRVQQAGELANRLAIREAVLKRGGSRAEAAFASRDLLNFTSRGGWSTVRQLIQVYPFLNARLQGLHKLARAFAEDPVRGTAYAGSRLMLSPIFLRGMMIFGVSSMLYALYMGDDELKERYEAIPEWDRDANYHILIPREFAERYGMLDHYRLPKAFEISLLFSTIPERLMHAGIKGGREVRISMERIGQGLLSTLALNPIPQFAMPLVELDRNKSFFFDRPIITDYQERLPPELRYQPWTTSTAILASEYGGKYVGLSPAGIEHLVRGYTGGMGMYFLAATSVLSDMALDRPPQPEKRIDQYPILNRFIRQNPETGNRWADEFWKVRNELDTALAAQREARKTGTVADEEKVEKKYAPVIDQKSDVRSIERQMSRIAREVRDVNADRNMTPAQKRKRLDELTLERNTAAAGVKGIVERIDEKR